MVRVPAYSGILRAEAGWYLHEPPAVRSFFASMPDCPDSSGFHRRTKSPCERDPAHLEDYRRACRDRREHEAFRLHGNPRPPCRLNLGRIHSAWPKLSDCSATTITASCRNPLQPHRQPRPRSPHPPPPPRFLAPPLPLL